jgi:hypothetical protein
MPSCIAASVSGRTYKNLVDNCILRSAKQSFKFTHLKGTFCTHVGDNCESG